MTCDKVDAKVRIKDDGSWEILRNTWQTRTGLRKKKSLRINYYKYY